MKYNLREMLYHLKSKDYAKYNGIDKYNENVQYLKDNIYEAIKNNIEFFTYHPKLYQNQNILFQIPISCFNNLKLNLDDLLEIQNRFISSATGLYGRKYDNSAGLLLSDQFGQLFKVYIHKDRNGFELSLYDTSGSIPLVKIKTKNNELAKEEVAQLQSAWDLLMKHYENQRKSKERYEEIKKHRDFINVEYQMSTYSSTYYKVTVSKAIPIELSKDEIAKYCDGWNYCFGGRCDLVKEDDNSKVYNVVVYTD